MTPQCRPIRQRRYLPLNLDRLQYFPALALPRLP